MARANKDDGTVFLYDLSSGIPQLSGSLNDPPSNEGFGEVMLRDRNRLIIGAPDDYSGIIDYKGAVYLYEIVNGTPVMVEKIWNPDGPFTGDRFGTAVESAGDFIFVGTPFNDDSPLSDVGSVYIYDVSTQPAQWVDTIENTTAPWRDDKFGNSLAYKDGRLYIGAPGKRYSSTNYPGIVRWHNVDENGQASEYNDGRIWPPNRADNDGADFGSKVIIRGNTMVVTAPGDYLGEANRGAVYVYDISGEEPALLHTIENPETNSNRFGSAAQFNGDKLLIGMGFDDTLGTNTGLAYLYDMTGPSPVLEKTFNNPHPSNSDYYGLSVGMGNGMYFIGSYGEDTNVLNEGRIYVYGEADETLNPTGLVIDSGVVQQGSVESLESSDNQHLVTARNAQSLNAVVSVQVTGHAFIQYPSSLELTVEAGVFSRVQVTQSVLLYNVDTGLYEEVDSKSASRLGDTTSTIAISSDPGRFVNHATGEVKAIIRFEAMRRRASFSSRIDHVELTLE